MPIPELPKDDTYLFHLTQGEHSLRLIADASPVSNALLALRQTLDDLRTFDTDIRTISGDYGKFGAANIDVNRTWEIKKLMPDIEERLQSYIDDLERIVAYLQGLNGARTDLTASIDIGISTLNSMLNNVERVANQLTDLTTVQSQIGSWIGSADKQPLLLDSLEIRTPNSEGLLRTAKAWSRWGYSAQNLGRTFYQKYSEKRRIER